MSKRIRRAPEEGDQHEYNPEDFVSRMPDEILVTILSYLPVKDASVTRHLSKRWRYMWRRSVHLDFQDDERMEKIVLQPELRFPTRNRYINWVNRVICHHNSPMVKDFIICFDLDKHSKGALTKWIEFAISKNVQNLELNLIEAVEIFSDHARNFVFPSKILEKKTRFSSRRQSMIVPSMPSTTMNEIKFLRSLILKCVNLNDETIGKIMKSCLVLEHLFIFNSGHMVNVKISGPGLALRKLEINYCPGIQSIEICDSNLASFQYLGLEITLKLKNNPSLETISIGQGYSGIANNFFQQISCCIPYLRVLELSICRPQENMHLLSFPELPNVKELSMKVGAWGDDSLLGMTCLAKACPNLQKFKAKLIWRTPLMTLRGIRSAIRHEHKHLEQVEISGYYGRISDLELALYFYENSIALKRLVVDPTYQAIRRNPNSNQFLSRENFTRCIAHLQLKRRISRGVELVIL